MAETAENIPPKTVMDPVSRVVVLQRLLQSILLTNEKPMTIAQLEAEYKSLEGKFIPSDDLGFKGTASFLQSAPDLYDLFYYSGQLCVSARAQKATSHVTDLIKEQRRDPKKQVFGSIPTHVEEEILCLLATQPNHTIQLTALPQLYSSLFGRPLTYPKGKLPAWLSTAERFVVTGESQQRIVEPLRNVDMAIFRYRAQQLQANLDQSRLDRFVAYGPAKEPTSRASNGGMPSFHRAASFTPRGEFSTHRRSNAAETPAVSGNGFPSDRCATSMSRTAVTTFTSTNSQQVPEKIRQRLLPILETLNGPVFISAIQHAYNVLNDKDTLNEEELVGYARQMPECELIGPRERLKVCPTANGRQGVLEGLCTKIDCVTNDTVSTTTDARNGISTGEISPVAENYQAATLCSPPLTRDDNGSSPKASCNSAEISGSSQRTVIANFREKPDASPFKRSAHVFSEALLRRGKGARGRIVVHRSVKSTWCLSVGQQLALIKLFDAYPGTPRSDLVNVLQDVLGDKATSETLNAASVELLEKGYGLLDVDEYDRLQRRTANGEGVFGDSSKLTWIPQRWPSASCMETSNLPVGFSVSGTVVRVDIFGCYWFQPDDTHYPNTEGVVKIRARPPTELVEVGKRCIFMEFFREHATNQQAGEQQQQQPQQQQYPRHALVLQHLGNENYLIYLPVSDERRVTHSSCLFPIAFGCESDIVLPTLRPLFFVKAMGRMPYQHQQITIRVVSKLDFGMTMACLDSEECCASVQIGAYNNNDTSLLGQPSKPGHNVQVLVIVRWAGKTLVMLDDIVEALRPTAGSARKLKVHQLDELPWADYLRQHLQTERYLPTESDVEPSESSVCVGPQLGPSPTFVYLDELISLLGDRLSSERAVNSTTTKDASLLSAASESGRSLRQLTYELMFLL